MTNPKSYYRPKTLAEALELAKSPDSIALAGGGATLDTLDLPYEIVVDLQDIVELKQIEVSGGGYTLGGAVALQQIVELPDLHPVIRRSLTRAIPLNQRHQISLAESLRRRERFPEWMVVLAALDVGIEMVKPDGSRETRAFAERIGEWTKAEKDSGGLVSGVRIHFYQGYKQGLGLSQVARTPADDPIVSAAAYVRLDADGIPDIIYSVMSGLSADPNDLTYGQFVYPENSDPYTQPFTEASLEAMVEHLQVEVNYTDYRGSAEYRAAMARVCLKRALTECLEQLG